MPRRVMPWHSINSRAWLLSIGLIFLYHEALGDPTIKIWIEPSGKVSAEVKIDGSIPAAPDFAHAVIPFALSPSAVISFDDIPEPRLVRNANNHAVIAVSKWPGSDVIEFVIGNALQNTGSKKLSMQIGSDPSKFEEPAKSLLPLEDTIADWTVFVELPPDARNVTVTPAIYSSAPGAPIIIASPKSGYGESVIISLDNPSRQRKTEADNFTTLAAGLFGAVVLVGGAGVAVGRRNFWALSLIVFLSAAMLGIFGYYYFVLETQSWLTLGGITTSLPAAVLNLCIGIYWLWRKQAYGVVRGDVLLGGKTLAGADLRLRDDLETEVDVDYARSAEDGRYELSARVHSERGRTCYLIAEAEHTTQAPIQVVLIRSQDTTKQVTLEPIRLIGRWTLDRDATERELQARIAERADIGDQQDIANRMAVAIVKSIGGLAAVDLTREGAIVEHQAEGSRWSGTWKLVRDQDLNAQNRAEIVESRRGYLGRFRFLSIRQDGMLQISEEDEESILPGNLIFRPEDTAS